MAKIIQLVGTSGSGKTTVHTRIANELRKYYTVKEIVEPGPLRELAKSYRLLKNKNPWTEAAIFTTDRVITYFTRILPRMKEEKLIFLSARGFFDTFVYQGLLDGVDLEAIIKMNQDIPFPDLTLALIVDGKIGHERLLNRNLETREALSKNETVEKINLLADKYKQLTNYFPHIPIEIIDTTYLNKEQTFQKAFDIVIRSL